MEDRPILGLTEEIIILGKTTKKLVARVDTGATASSIDSSLAEELELGPVVKSKIVRSASGVGKRPVMRVKVNIHGKEMEADFTVANRSHMTYKALIGQNILKDGKFMIDPLQKVKE